MDRVVHGLHVNGHIFCKIGPSLLFQNVEKAGIGGGSTKYNELVHCFCQGSGELVNRAKLAVFFNKRPPDNERFQFARILDSTNVGCQD
ncbi:conserved hypothetical protein [Ricinus communis]|uniref:Uncharacterized protein n=1 Tax=Ricinus communis TaxID=3988 RepID=B9S272_RICCO|nr:conserved hypothetical protein [Ricinus communis]